MTLSFILGHVAMFIYGIILGAILLCLLDKKSIEVKTIEVNKNATLQTCMELYQKEGVATLIEDGNITDFVKED